MASHPGSDKAAAVDAPTAAHSLHWHDPVVAAGSRVSRTQLVCFVGFALATVHHFAIALRISSPTHPAFRLYEDRLSPGWMRLHMDLSDYQYRQFREGLAPLLIFAGLHIACGRLRTCFGADKSRLRFMASQGLFSLVVLHGVSALKVVALVVLSFSLARRLVGTRALVPAVWTVNLATLFANELCHGYSFGSISSRLSFLAGLDGALPRWHIIFPFTMLRLVSFSIDWHRSLLAHRERQHDEGGCRYSLSALLAYALYPPLYIAGPIVSFDDFVSQADKPRSPPGAVLLKLGAGLVVYLLLIEWTLNYLYVVAIKDADIFHAFTVTELGVISFFTLFVVWLKLLIPWRFFRLWALIDGLDAPENMQRCLWNHYSALEFWRSWHRSFNLWLVRYVYLPLGGRDRPVFATVVCFAFVAFWHDLRLRLLAWSWVVCLFILPEIAARRLLPSAKYGHLAWYPHLRAVGGAFNIMLMMIANSIGFTLGLDGTRYVVRQMFSSLAAFMPVIAVIVQLFMLCHVMFALRSYERSKGIGMKAQ